MESSTVATILAAILAILGVGLATHAVYKHEKKKIDNVTTSTSTAQATILLQTPATK